MMEGVNSSMMYLIYYKNFCKCHNVPPLSTIRNERVRVSDEVSKFVQVVCNKLTTFKTEEEEQGSPTLCTLTDLHSSFQNLHRNLYVLSHFC
jgi:hypothetical protein